MPKRPLPPTVRAFLWFRVFFNARFYYPVLAVFFVDLGITLDRYALLNTAWAASIVLFEVPLGAVADRVGRRPLIVTAALLIVVEMAVLGFAPTGDPTLLFWVFFVNRVLSGLAEAAASGADEALAYDTLASEGRRKEWPSVLGSLQRRMSIAFVISMVCGAAVYDPDLLNGVLAWIGVDAGLDQLTTTRFPVYLTLVLSFGAVASALRMRECETCAGPGRPESMAGGLAEVKETALWIRRTTFVAALILFALALDSMVRLFLTLNSSYYRMIGIPAALFGVLGAGFSALGFLSPSLAEYLVRRRSPLTNYALLFALALVGFAGVAGASSWVGILFVGLLAISFHLLNFFSSHYLNEATESHRRATVLSFKSLAGNLAYGAVGWGYAVLMQSMAGGSMPPPGSEIEQSLLARTLVWIPVALAIVAVPMLLRALRIPRMRQRDG
jgi:MFS family permease